MDSIEQYLLLIKKMKEELVIDNRVCIKTELEFTVLMIALRALEIDLNNEITMETNRNTRRKQKWAEMPAASKKREMEQRNG